MLEGGLSVSLRLGHPNLPQARLAFGCWLFGSLASTFAVLCTQAAARALPADFVGSFSAPSAIASSGAH
jgi:hypothetical protein